MAFVDPTNRSVLAFDGLHLYHANRSNCSGRVRLLLEEKQLPWKSHHIDLAKKENVSEEYFGINPKGVVPTLVHDGTVVTESNDILIYLEETFPEPGFRPVAPGAQQEIDDWLKLSGDIHIPGIKTFQYIRVNAARMAKSEKEVALYRELQKDPALLEFHGKHDLPGRSFSDQDNENSLAMLNGNFARMDQILDRGGWLVGGAYTLADISWAPSITTLLGGGFDFEPYPQLQDWYRRISERPAFDKAITAWRQGS
ncbi:MAG: glutathione S-transferase family protein [Rhodospirillales bacterium]|jgi:GST-like protein